MIELERHRSQDGSLQLIVSKDDDGDVSLGFANGRWHTHADVLAATYRCSVQTAIRRFVSDVLENRAIIAVSWIEGTLDDIWITDDPGAELSRVTSGEELKLRYWDGSAWRAS
jgi:hypothetical protein